MNFLPHASIAQNSSFEGGALHIMPTLPFGDVGSAGSVSSTGAAGAMSLQAREEQLSATLIALCSCDWHDFVANKSRLVGVPEEELRGSCARLLTKNARSLKLLTIVCEPGFLSDWDAAPLAQQLALYRQLALSSINRSTKEHAFHRVLVLLRREYLSQPCNKIPTKLRLRDCNQIIAEFMSEFASRSEYNQLIVLAALEECEQTGSGHLPLQQSRALMKRLKFARKKEALLLK